MIGFDWVKCLTVNSVCAWLMCEFTKHVVELTGRLVAFPYGFASVLKRLGAYGEGASLLLASSHNLFDAVFKFCCVFLVFWQAIFTAKRNLREIWGLNRKMLLLRVGKVAINVKSGKSRIFEESP